MIPLRIAPLLRCSRNSTNIRIPLIYFINRFFLMFVRVENVTAFSCKHEQRSHFRFASSCNTPTNCSAASLLPQFYKHSDSADLFHKSLLPHVCAGRKCYRLFVQARTAVTLSTLGYHMRSGHLIPRRSVHVSRIFFVSVISAI